MDKNNLTLVQQLSLKDVDDLFNKIMTNTPTNTSLMGIFSYLRSKELFEQDFFEYWFIKLLNSSPKIGFFYLDEPNYKIFGFDAKSVGKLLTPHLEFLQNSCCYEDALQITESALTNGAVFEQNIFDKLTNYNLDQYDFKKFKEQNSKNREVYLNHGLASKAETAKVKI